MIVNTDLDTQLKVLGLCLVLFSIGSLMYKNYRIESKTLKFVTPTLFFCLGLLMLIEAILVAFSLYMLPAILTAIAGLFLILNAVETFKNASDYYKRSKQWERERNPSNWIAKFWAGWTEWWSGYQKWQEGREQRKLVLQEKARLIAKAELGMEQSVVASQPESEIEKEGTPS